MKRRSSHLKLVLWLILLQNWLGFLAQLNSKTIPLDLFLRSVCWGHASDGLHRCLYNEILCLQVVSCGLISCMTQKIENLSEELLLLQERQSWKGHTYHWDAGWLAACLDLACCFCLVRASKPIINQLTWPTPTIRVGSLLAQRSCVRNRGSILESSGSWAQLHHK